ncbi:glycosyl hydrolase family 114 [Cereibacter changlensis]|uniref:Glycosyl hydrolase family 114 n=1 Tax=Cereibacter changlensis TaxID=402884 RepID=A0A2W7RPF6_9RHOB|nr:glycosyl hydrolase family 114 [Cereibacter changlensis]
MDWPVDLLVPGPAGAPLADPGWPDEFLLDISTVESRAANLAQVLPSIRTCADKGFDAVEFDNLDSYTRAEGRLSLDDAVTFASLLVSAARDHGLASGQKNTPELDRRGRDEVGFGFAVVEECHRWGECAAYTDIYGAGQVLGIEYTVDLRGSFADACADPDRPESLILRDRKLAAAGAAGHVFQACAPRR